MTFNEEKLQIEDKEITLIGLLLFIKASRVKILKSTVVCLFVGVCYYFSVQKMYEASVTFQVAKVMDEPVETPESLLEKIKLPSYFSKATLQACGLDTGPSSQAKVVDKLNISINKSTRWITFVNQASSPEEAKGCLHAASTEVANYQGAITESLLKRKKEQLQELNEKLKYAEEDLKNMTASKGVTLNGPRYIPNSLQQILINSKLSVIMELRTQVSTLGDMLNEPKTHNLKIISSVYAGEAPVKNRRPLFIFAVCLSIGIFSGLILTWVMRELPLIRRQMREAEGRIR